MQRTRNQHVSHAKACRWRQFVRAADAHEHGGGGGSGDSRNPVKFGLSYQINLVLPKTDDIAVFNAIFKSLKDHLLKE